MFLCLKLDRMKCNRKRKIPFPFVRLESFFVVVVFLRGWGVQYVSICIGYITRKTYYYIEGGEGLGFKGWFRERL